MFLHVQQAKYVKDYVLWIRFNNGDEGQVDLKDELYGEVFSPLRKPQMFRSFRVDPEIETIVWGNGADMAPEFLYGKIRKTA